MTEPTKAQLLAKVAALEAEAARARRTASEALEQQAATGEILRAISNSPKDTQPVFDAIAQSATRLCEARDASIFRVDGDRLAFVAHHGPIAQRHGDFSLPLVRGTVGGRSVLESRTVQVADLQNEDREFPDAVENAWRFGFRTILSVPLLRDGIAIGGIQLRRMEAQLFSERQIALLQTFADQAVIAIENVRLFTELQHKNEALTAAHTQVTEALEQQTATSEILSVISSSPTATQPVFDAIAANATRLCDAVNGLVLRFDGQMVHLSAHHNVDPERLESLQRIYPMPPNPGAVSGRVILSRAVVHVPDVTEDRAYTLPVATTVGYRSVLGVPLLREGVPLGTILIARDRVAPFSDAHIALLQTFADQAVIAIENVRLFTELQSSNRELTTALDQQTATGEVLRAISQAQIDAQPVFDIIARSARRLCGAAYGQVQLRDGDLIQLAALDSVNPEGYEATRAVYPLRVGDGSAGGRAIATRAVTHIPDLLDDQVYAFKQAWEASGLRSLLAVPMLRDGEPIGTIGVGRIDPGPFPQAHIDLLRTFADQAVIAIENVRLFKELQARTQDLTRSVSELRALGEVGQAISSTLDLQTVLRTIVTRATELSRTDAGVIYEYDAQREVFLPRATERLSPDIVETMLATPVRKGEGATGQLAQVDEPVQVPDVLAAPAESRVRAALVRSGYRGLLAVPLVSEDRLLGGLTVLRKVTGEFEPEVVDLLRTFATQSALAIQNARLFTEIEIKSRELEVASQHKSEFLASMSHELRTPLNAIIGFSDVLLQGMFGETNDKQSEYLRDILASGQHLLSLINDILDLSKIEAGRMDLDIADFHLPTAIDDALLLMRERAGRRGITLERHVDEHVGEIRADQRKVKQILLNLLSNAVKFTPEGGRIDVRAAPANGTVEISVTDTGVGIAPQDHEAVFEEFRQVGKAEKKAEGTGLGLALCRKFVELHGGRISVKSRLGAGSTFTFSLPRNR